MSCPDVLGQCEGVRVHYFEPPDGYQGPPVPYLAITAALAATRFDTPSAAQQAIKDHYTGRQRGLQVIAIPRLDAPPAPTAS
jgi:hypothetical protein